MLKTCFCALIYQEAHSARDCAIHSQILEYLNLSNLEKIFCDSALRWIMRLFIRMIKPNENTYVGINFPTIIRLISDNVIEKNSIGDI